MNISAPFIARPVATTLLTIGIAIAGALAFFSLPVAPVPQVDIPTVIVLAQLPGASPDTVANSVASPLERHLGRIADVTEMTSSSSLGITRIGLQFGLDRDIDGAARDVQAGINAARADLPTNLRANPTYRKVNPADAPIVILALTSRTLTRGQLYDAASNVLQQRLSQIKGVGQVIIGGATLPAVRVELNADALNKFGVGLEDVRAALASANANSPKGAIEEGVKHFQIYNNDQATKAEDYAPLVIAYRNGNAVRLYDVATVTDSVEDVRNAGYFNEDPAVAVIPFTQPGANIIETVELIKAELPTLEAAMPGDINVTIAGDKSLTIRASLADTEMTLVAAVLLVIGVVYFFLRDWRATLVPSIAVPVSIIGSFGVMYLAGFTLDILSLMALTIATGFVVDDAVVVVENTSRHIEAGMSQREAALRGAREVGFTVLSISLSLVAVFTPILFMGGIPGRFFREFALTLSIAILISLVISLTTTPMLCALLLRKSSAADAARPGRRTFFERMLQGYEKSLIVALRHPSAIMLLLIATVALNIWLIDIIPKGFFPTQDTGRLTGVLRGDQAVSFQAMQRKLVEMIAIVRRDPAVDNVIGFTGVGSGGQAAAVNTASVYVNLKGLDQRHDSAEEVIARLRPELSKIPGGEVFLSAIQDFRVGARQSNALYQYTLLGSGSDLYEWTPKLVDALNKGGVLRDVSSDQQLLALEADVDINRDTASRLGLTAAQIDNTLYDSFGQRQVSVIYQAQNQYHVVMEIDPRNTQRPELIEQRLRLHGGRPGARHGHDQRAGRHRRRQNRGSGNALHIIDQRSDRRRRGDRRRHGLRPQRFDQCARRGRQRHGLDGLLGQHQSGVHGAAADRRELQSRPHRARHQSSGPLRRDDNLLQPRRRRVAVAGARRHRPRDEADRHAADAQGLARRNRAALYGIAEDRASSHFGGARRRLHRARDALRKLCASDHDPLDAALGGRRRNPGAAAFPHGVQHHRLHWRDPAHRHREEERDSDDRLRHRSQKGARRVLLRRHL